MVSSIALVGNNVNCFMLALSRRKVKRGVKKLKRNLTKAVAHPVLTTDLVSNIRADAHVDHGQVLHTPVSGI